VTIVVTGNACSAASIILQAGKRRLITQNSFVMIHAGHLEEQPNISQADKRAWMRLVRAHNNRMVDLYAKLLKQTHTQIRKLLKTDQIYIGEEAVTAGLVDEIWGG
jgi:ATP-dependent protease ClpP protease subunit